MPIGSIKFYWHLVGLALAACLQSSLLFTWPLIGIESGLDANSQFAIRLGACWLLSTPMLLCLPAWLAAGRLGPRCSLWLGGCLVAMCLTGPFIVGGDGAWLAALSLCAGCLGLSLTRLVITAPPVFLLPWLLPWQLGRQQLLLLAVCACGAGASIGAILAPPLFRLLCDWLSWKGACLATAGCLLNWLVAGALMLPTPQPPPQPHHQPEADTSRRPIPASVRDPNYYYCLYYYCKVRGAVLTLATDNEQCYHGNGEKARSESSAAGATAKRKQQSCDSGLGDSMNLSAGASNSRCSGAASRHAVLAPSAESASAAAEVEREELASWQPGSRLQRPGHEAADEHQGQESAAGEEPAAEDDDLLFSSNRNLARLSGDPRLGSSDDVFLDVGTNEGVNNADSDGDAADENDDEADQLLQPPGTPPPVSLSAVGSGGSGASGDVVVRFELLRDADEEVDSDDQSSSVKESTACFADFPSNIGQVSDLNSAGSDSYRIFLQREPASLPTIPEHSELDMELVYSEHTADVDGGQGIDELMDRPLDELLYGGHLDLSQSECLEDSTSSLFQQQQQQQQQQASSSNGAVFTSGGAGSSGELRPLCQQHKSRSRSLARSSCAEDDRSIGSSSIGSLQRQASSASSVDQLLSRRRARSMESLKALAAAPASGSAAEGGCCSGGSSDDSAVAGSHHQQQVGHNRELLTRDQLADLVLTKSDPELFLVASRLEHRQAGVSDNSSSDEAAEEEAELEPLVAAVVSCDNLHNSYDKDTNTTCNNNISSSSSVDSSSAFSSMKSLSPMSLLIRRPAYLLACFSFALQFASMVNSLVYLAPLLAWQRGLARYDCAMAAAGLGLLPGGTVAAICLAVLAAESCRSGVEQQRRPQRRRRRAKTILIGDVAAGLVGVVGSAVLAASAGWLSREGGVGASFHGVAFAASGIGFCLGLFGSAGPAALIRCCRLRRLRWRDKEAGSGQMKRKLRREDKEELWSIALASVLCCWTLSGLACLLLGTGSAIWLHSSEVSLSVNSVRLSYLFWINCLIACIAVALATASAIVLNWSRCVRMLRGQLTTPAMDRRASYSLEEITAL
ncbi:hypothetical protein BOX15_Mlig029100g1 [Macrostomum lignano]|uniref:Uncharacterized protein n=1 Tax=Macrostomum lignano TaxID=282301 RepID=A0A267EEQ9_9PLAT|nr:hypothetical protein BOX15_Mlig029100g1 [Macrostomum lignano]